MKNFNEILNTYNEADRNYIIRELQFSMIFNSNSKAPETEEEFKIFCDKKLNERDEELARAKAKADKKAEKELAKAEALGMTIEEYREYDRLAKGKKRHESNIRRLEREIEKLNREIEYEKRKVAEYERKIEKWG